MYGKLWNFVNQYIDKEHALAVYLPILIVGWTIIGTVLGMGVCSVIRINLVQSLSDMQGLYWGFSEESSTCTANKDLT